MDEKKKYRVTNPVSWGGRIERGVILELTEKEAIDIGEVELVVFSPPGFPDSAAQADVPAASEVPAAPTDGDYAPVLSPDEQAAADAAAKAAEAEPSAPAEATPTEQPAPEETATPEVADASNSVNA